MPRRRAEGSLPCGDESVWIGQPGNRRDAPRDPSGKPPLHRPNAFGFPSSDSEAESPPKSALRSDRKVIYEQWRSDTAVSESTKRRKAKEQKKDKRGDVAGQLNARQVKVVCRRALSLATAAYSEFRANFWMYIWFFSGFAFLATVFYLKAREEFFSQFGEYDFERAQMTDHYAALKIPRTASAADVKRAYRELSLKWHPDRNPACGEKCVEAFRTIQEAYQTLVDPDLRLVYDQSSADVEKIPSETLTLDRRNFFNLISENSGSDIWCIQVYEDASYFAHRFASAWDYAAEYYGSAINFGRLSTTSVGASQLIRLLPVKITTTPAVVLMIPGHLPKVFDETYTVSPNAFVQWIGLSLPDETSALTSTDALDHFLERPHPPGGGHAVAVVSSKQPKWKIAAAALKWRYIFSIGVLSSYDVPESLLRRLDVSLGTSDEMLLVDPVTAKVINRIDPNSLWIPLKTSKFEAQLQALQQYVAPFAVKENIQRLCRPNHVAHRLLCLAVLRAEHVLESPSAAVNVTGIMTVLEASAPSFTKANGSKPDWSDDDDDTVGDEEDEESPIHIQTIQITVSPSSSWWPYTSCTESVTAALPAYRLFSEAFALGSPSARVAFHTSGVALLLLDFDRRQVSTMAFEDAQRLDDLREAIDGGDLKFQSWDSITTAPVHRCKSSEDIHLCLRDCSRKLSTDVQSYWLRTGWKEVCALLVLLVVGSRVVLHRKRVRSDRLAAQILGEAKDSRSPSKKDSNRLPSPRSRQNDHSS